MQCMTQKFFKMKCPYEMKKVTGVPEARAQKNPEMTEDHIEDDGRSYY